jgi:hypothetical protein
MATKKQTPKDTASEPVRCSGGVCNPRRTQGLKAPAPKGTHTLANLTGPGLSDFCDSRDRRPKRGEFFFCRGPQRGPDLGQPLRHPIPVRSRRGILRHRLAFPARLQEEP